MCSPSKNSPTRPKNPKIHPPPPENSVRCSALAPVMIKVVVSLRARAHPGNTHTHARICAHCWTGVVDSGAQHKPAGARSTERVWFVGTDCVCGAPFRVSQCSTFDTNAVNACWYVCHCVCVRAWYWVVINLFAECNRCASVRTPGPRFHRVSAPVSAPAHKTYTLH